MIEPAGAVSGRFPAFGLTLLVAGLVTSLAISVVGFVVPLCGAAGWFRDVPL
jgi:hypothetical protein